MTISSSLNAGVSGLTANSSRLAAISDNIANSSTTGYKRVSTSFQSMVVGQSGGTYAAGGVSISNTRLISERSSLISTSNATDLAISGRGFLPVASIATVEAGGSANMMLTRTGSFTTNDEGYLVTNSGLVLMGIPANEDETIPVVARDSDAGLEPIRFNVNQLEGSPTTQIRLGVNLPATDALAGGTPVTHSNSTAYFDNLGKSESLNIEYTSTGVGNEWSIVITDSATGGGATPIGEYTVTFNDSRTGGGTIASVVDGASGLPYDAATGTVIVNTASGPIEIEIGAPGSDKGLTQLSDSFVAATIEKDGSEAASFSSVEIDDGGFVHVLYNNGSSRIVYQVPVADMPNADGMISLDNQTFMPSTSSGPYYLWDAGTGPTGTVAAYRQEESAVDVATELTSMIQTQRAYSSNAKVIQTVDEMLQETTNIKR